MGRLQSCLKHISRRYWGALVNWFWWYKKGSARAAVMKWKSAWCSKMKIDIRSWSKSGVAWVSCAALVSLEAINVHRRFSKDYFHESTTGGNAECQSLKPQFVFSRWFSKPKDFYLGGVERYLHWTPSRWGDSFGSRLVRKLHAIRLSAYQQVIISEIAFISRASIKHAAAANFPSRVWPAGDLLMNRYAARRAKVFPGLSIKMSPFYCATKIQHFFLVHHVILEQNDARKRKQTLL